MAASQAPESVRLPTVWSTFQPTAIPSSQSEAHKRYIWLSKEGQLSQAKSPETQHQLSYGESLVKAYFSGINPADLKHHSLGSFDTVPGYDFAGTVIATSPGSPFPVGTLVGGTGPAGLNRKKENGAHQDVFIALNDLLFPLTGPITLPEAAGIGVPLRTAIIGLHGKLAIPLPWETSLPKGEGLLIWGGGSQVGGWAVQLARAAQVYPIYVIASTKHHQALRDLGATQSFDYALMDAQINTAIAAAAKADNGRISRAFDCIGPIQASGTSGNQEHMSYRCVNVLKGLSPTHEPLNLATVDSGGPREARTVFALPDRDAEWIIGGEKVVIPRDEQLAEMTLLMIDHVVENWSRVYRIPGKLRAVQWESAIPEMEKASHLKGQGMEKMVIQH